MSINNPEQRHNTNPDIADTTHDLKALHAQPAVIPPREHRDERLGWKKPAAVVALLGAGAAAAFGITKGFGGESTNAAPDRSPAASATPTPGATETAKPAEHLTPGEAIGIRETSFEDLNVKPDQSVIERAMQPTPASMDASDALIDLSRKENVYQLSGDMEDTSGEEIILTPESVKIGNELLASFQGSGISEQGKINSDGVRRGIALRTNYYGDGKLINGETGKSEYATMNMSLANIVKVSETDTTATFKALRVINTNYEALDRDDVFNNPDMGKNQEVPVIITIGQEDGKWLYESVEKVN